MPTYAITQNAGFVIFTNNETGIPFYFRKGCTSFVPKPINPNTGDNTVGVEVIDRDFQVQIVVLPSDVSSPLTPTVADLMTLLGSENYFTGCNCGCGTVPNFEAQPTAVTHTGEADGQIIVSVSGCNEPITINSCTRLANADGGAYNPVAAPVIPPPQAGSVVITGLVFGDYEIEAEACGVTQTLTARVLEPPQYFTAVCDEPNNNLAGCPTYYLDGGSRNYAITSDEPLYPGQVVGGGALPTQYGVLDYAAVGSNGVYSVGSVQAANIYLTTNLVILNLPVNYTQIQMSDFPNVIFQKSPTPNPVYEQLYIDSPNALRDAIMPVDPDQTDVPLGFVRLLATKFTIVSWDRACYRRFWQFGCEKAYTTLAETELYGPFTLLQDWNAHPGATTLTLNGEFYDGITSTPIAIEMPQAGALAFTDRWNCQVLSFDMTNPGLVPPYNYGAYYLNGVKYDLTSNSLINKLLRRITHPDGITPVDCLLSFFGKSGIAGAGTTGSIEQAGHGKFARILVYDDALNETQCGTLASPGLFFDVAAGQLVPITSAQPLSNVAIYELTETNPITFGAAGNITDTSANAYDGTLQKNVANPQPSAEPGAFSMK